MPLAAVRPASEHAFQLRPRYCECDPMGVVHHAAYIPWLELGRTELLRTSGVSYAQLEASGVFLVVAKLELRYRRAARYDELLEVRTRVAAAGRVKIEHQYEIVRIGDGGAPTESILGAASTIACVDAHGRLQELPAWLTEAPGT